MYVRLRTETSGSISNPENVREGHYNVSELKSDVYKPLKNMKHIVLILPSVKRPNPTLLRSPPHSLLFLTQIHPNQFHFVPPTFLDHS